MQIEQKQTNLRKLIADKNKLIISKTLDEEERPTVIAKEIYLAEGASENDFIEIDEKTLENQDIQVL